MQSTLQFQAELPAPNPTILKLHRPGPRVGAHSSLRECVEGYVLPELDERSQATLVEYESMLNRWEELTTNPPIGTVEREAIKSFRKRLLDTPYSRGKRKKKRSEATVNKIMRTLKAAISPLWPPDRHNPGGKGLLPFCKFPERLSEQLKLPIVFELSEMSSLYLHCGACRPDKVHRKTPLHNPFLWLRAWPRCRCAACRWPAIGAARSSSCGAAPGSTGIIPERKTLKSSPTIPRAPKNP